MPIIILQCAAKKIPGEQSSLVKYDTRQHRKVLDFMINGGWQAGWQLYFLSAGYGLVSATETLPDYDEVLTHERQIPELVRKSAKHAKEIRDEYVTNEEDVFFYGSRAYYAAVRVVLQGLDIAHIGRGARGCGDYFSSLVGWLDGYSCAS